MAQCKKCGCDKPIEDFGKHKSSPNGRRSTCKKCRMHNDRARRYDITIDELNELLTIESCEICGILLDPKKVGQNIDHCHETGRVRGVLCNHCNWALGSFKDNVAILESAINYLKTR